MTTKIEIAEYIQPEDTGKKILSWEVFSYLASSRFWNAVRNEPDFVLSLENLGHLKMDGLIWLYFVLVDRAVRSLSTKIILPSKIDLVAFIKYVGLHQLQSYLNFTFLNAFMLDRPGPEDEYIPKDELVINLHKPVRVDGDNFDKVYAITGSYVESYLLQKLKYPPMSDLHSTYITPFKQTLRELIHNIGYHGGFQLGDGLGYVSFMPVSFKAKFNKAKYIRYCFMDIGLGFAKTLSQKTGKQYESDEDAIFDGLLFRFFNKEEGIVGLYPTLKFIKARHGLIQIRTGSYSVYIDMRAKKTREKFDAMYDTPTIKWLKDISVSRKIYPIKGTHICIDLQI